MNKVFVLPAREDWIVDRFVNEWSNDNTDITTNEIQNADVIWLLASWCWNQVPLDFLRSKKVIATVHHIYSDKFDNKKVVDFINRDQFVDVYHVYNEETFEFIKKLTKKRVELIKYWANQNIWKKTQDKEALRRKYNLPNDSFLIGSFQRDTEGHDLITPKLEKGPDIFCQFLEERQNFGQKVHAVLAGWRRNYVINRLQKSNISFSYFERPDQSVINDLYQTLDLYPITSRCEGGPQALIECGLLEVPTISRDVGIARQLLPSISINDDLHLTKPNVPNVRNMLLPDGYNPYRKLILEL